jgi:hypothetical protein
MVTMPTASTPTATLGAGLRRDATPPVKSATPSVAADASAAAGERKLFRLTTITATGLRHRQAPKRR